MNSLSIRIALFFLLLTALSALQAQEIESGLLLVSEKKSKVIPVGKRIKVWAWEDNQCYKAKLLAVDKEYIYLSTGDQIPLSEINAVKRKRIMFHDVGKASVTTGMATGEVFVNSGIDIAVGNIALPANDAGAFDDLRDGVLIVVGGAVIAVVAAATVGVLVITTGAVVSIFEPRYFSDEWDILPYNPATNVMFVN